MPFADKMTKLLLNSKGFDTHCHAVKILTAGNGSIKAELKVANEHVNILGGLHGGYTATLVDVISSLGLLSHEKGLKPSVSVNMNINYLSGAKEGDTVEIFANTLKVGKSLAFLQVELKNKATGVLLAKGSHTKFLLDK
ncbi:hypothetical protein AMK59_5515 [Oryctes borbonicus]|uniref:Thioesterase domain-containing protein n=1 Tax=Oryctes borbonicus TaxID=1629725 RepID=A0A0T6B2N1_9SCAR|nr:hypothetical protein AMK59_5515 [Oryctes borbonicus]